MDNQLPRFLFIVAVPVLAIVGGLVGLFALGALFDFLDNQKDFARRIEGLFRRPPKTPKMAGPDNYYQSYWGK